MSLFYTTENYSVTFLQYKGFPGRIAGFFYGCWIILIMADISADNTVMENKKEETYGKIH